MIRKFVTFLLLATVIYAALAVPLLFVLPPDPGSMPFFAFAIVVSLVGGVALVHENRYRRVVGAFR